MNELQDFNLDDLYERLQLPEDEVDDWLASLYAENEGNREVEESKQIIKLNKKRIFQDKFFCDFFFMIDVT